MKNVSIYKVTFIVNGEKLTSPCRFVLNSTNRRLYLGGKIGKSQSQPNFKGIIGVFKMNEIKLDMFSDVFRKKNINAFNTCQYIECQNGGECITAQNEHGFRCKCFDFHRGLFCEHKIDNGLCEKIKPCRNKAKCLEIQDSEKEEEARYKCMCDAGFSGKNCTKSSFL